ncbi:MAG: ribonuclease H-like domain-containing protein, partial [Thermoplasmata archaeon]
MRIVTAYYKTNPLKIMMVVQSDDFKNTIKEMHSNPPPYFYQSIENPLQIQNSSIIDAINGKFIKYTVMLPEQVAMLRNQYSYEDDIPYTKRVIYDLNMDLGKTPLSKCYIDTEAYNPNTRFTDFAVDEIKSISIITHDNRKFVIYNLKDLNAHSKTESHCINGNNATYIFAKTESELLDYFYNITQNESMLIGWNLRDFDYMFIKVRSIHNNKYAFNRYVWMDLMDLYKRFAANRSNAGLVTSYSLENVAQQELGIGKLDKSALFDGSMLKEMEYNLRDSELAKMIDEKTK